MISPTAINHVHRNKRNKEQNGFRKSRSCIDQLNTITQILEHRKQQNLQTFAAYIDFSKAYDRIPRGLLWQKLLDVGVSGKFLEALKSLYSNVTCAVRINGVLSDWFGVNIGLKQGCLISPMLFNLYLNDLVDCLKDAECGVLWGEEMLSVLLYADDILMVSESEQGLQKLLDILHEWCHKWKMVVNVDKTKIMHFRRGPATPRTNTTFRCGDATLEITESY